MGVVKGAYYERNNHKENTIIIVNKNKKCGEFMTVFELITLLFSFWLMMMLTMFTTYIVTKDKAPSVIQNVIDRTKREVALEPEVITEEMEYDMEEGVKYEYDTRF